MKGFSVLGEGTGPMALVLDEEWDGVGRWCKIKGEMTLDGGFVFEKGCSISGRMEWLGGSALVIGVDRKALAAMMRG
ncbi:hypothetical protein V6N12_062584 [Hibiscus sabdariffa]|uniref:Uncharacterized protein n=1 Tax=Hibiscus sabdariffa TaxID=183260 RepID=A0ABR2F9A3_9ROSI